MKRSGIGFLALLLSGTLFSQILDTSGAHTYKPAEVYRYSENDLRQLKIDSQELDTQMLGFYNHYPVYDEQFPFIDLGFEGSPFLKIHGAVQARQFLNLGNNTMDAYFFSDTIYNRITKDPYTRLNYSQGKKELIFIEATHAQQLSERLTFGVDYRRLKNQNLYFSNLQNSEQVRLANLFNTKFYTGFHSYNRRYELLFSYLWNKNSITETGGLSDPELFDLLSGRAKENNNPVKLTSAQNINAENAFKLVQFYRFSRQALDSTKPSDLTRFHSQLILSSAFRSNRLEYIDDFPDSAYYSKKIPELHDSIYHRTVSNHLQLMSKFKGLKLITGLEHRYDRIYQSDTSLTEYHSLYVGAEIAFDYKIVHLNISGRTGILGYNLGDYLLNADAGFAINKIKLGARLSSSLTEPGFLEQHFNSAARTWDLSLNKIALNNISGNISYQKDLHSLSLQILAQSILNYVYYTPENYVQQFSSAIGLLNATFGYKMAWKPLSLELQISNQQVNEPVILPRPEWYASGKLYSNFKLFKKNLQTQVGLETYWFSNFYAPVYSPFIRQWTISENIFTSYPPIQAFVNAKVKSFYFGVSVFNVQEGLMGQSYYSSPDYPMLPRMFRINIRWDLRN